MMRLVTYIFLMLGLSLGLSLQAIAAKNGENLTENDITKSTRRMLSSYHPNLVPNSIIESGQPIGVTTFNEDEFYITYRASLGLEILRCIDKQPYPLTRTGLNVEGHGHKGLTSLYSPTDANNTIIQPFMKYRSQTRLPTEQISIIVDGMSAGAHRAIETSIFLKQHPDTKNLNVVVLRYGDSKTFDGAAVSSIHNLIGKENIFSFHAKEDKIVEFMDLPGVVNSLGTRLEFLATDSDGYNARVRNGVFSGMDPNFRGILSQLNNPIFKPLAQGALKLFNLSPDVVEFLTPELWEKHQPVTYTDLCPSTFSKYKSEKIHM